jgi:ribosome biogenesis GTPase A
VPELLKEVQNKKHRLIFVGNKIDALPSGFTVDRLSLWVKNEIKKSITDPDVLENMTICLASAKKRTGVSKILTVLEKTKN